MTSSVRDADGFLKELDPLLTLRAQLSPQTKLSCDEMGVILPHDNDPDVTAPPPVYWNAAGAMYAYLVSEMAQRGVEVMTPYLVLCVPMTLTCLCL